MVARKPPECKCEKMHKKSESLHESPLMKLQWQQPHRPAVCRFHHSGGGGKKLTRCVGGGGVEDDDDR